MRQVAGKDISLFIRIFVFNCVSLSHPLTKRETIFEILCEHIPRPKGLLQNNARISDEMNGKLLKKAANLYFQFVSTLKQVTK